RPGVAPEQGDVRRGHRRSGGRARVPVALLATGDGGGGVRRPRPGRAHPGARIRYADLPAARAEPSGAPGHDRRLSGRPGRAGAGTGPTPPVPAPGPPSPVETAATSPAPQGSARACYPLSEVNPPTMAP